MGKFIKFKLSNGRLCAIRKSDIGSMTIINIKDEFKLWINTSEFCTSEDHDSNESAEKRMDELLLILDES